jgi:ABC-type dipeptide/oligopeptide/nickel transport system permease subunit
VRPALRRGIRGGLRLWPLIALGLFQAVSWVLPEPERLTTGAAWPSPQHPLGVDGRGRDFAWVVISGAERFTLPAAVVALLLAAAIVAYSALTLTRGPSVHGFARAASRWVGTLPRFLVVLLAMMALPEPNVWVLCAVLLALYLPVALDEAAVRLEVLGREQVLLGAHAHGVPLRRVVLRHLALGHLRTTLSAHATYLFAQVALTEIAVAYVFGGSAILPGLATSWGVELRQLMGRIPHPGSRVCWGQPSPCEAHVEAFQAAALVAVVALLIGGVIRLSRGWHSDAGDRA